MNEKKLKEIEITDDSSSNRKELLKILNDFYTLKEKVSAKINSINQEELSEEDKEELIEIQNMFDFEKILI